MRNVRASAQAGLHFARVLTAHFLTTYVATIQRAFPLAPPTPSDRASLDIDTLNYIDVMTHRVIDGTSLYAALVRGRKVGGQFELPAGAPFNAIVSGDRPEVTLAAGGWLDWYDRQFSQPAPSDSGWIRERIEYTFAVSAGSEKGEVALVAPEYAAADSTGLTST